MNYSEKLNSEVQEQINKTAKNFREDVERQFSLLNISTKKASFLDDVMREWPEIKELLSNIETQSATKSNELLISFSDLENKLAS